MTKVENNGPGTSVNRNKANSIIEKLREEPTCLEQRSLTRLLFQSVEQGHYNTVVFLLWYTDVDLTVTQSGETILWYLLSLIEKIKKVSHDVNKTVSSYVKIFNILLYQVKKKGLEHLFQKNEKNLADELDRIAESSFFQSYLQEIIWPRRLVSRAVAPTANPVVLPSVDEETKFESKKAAPKTEIKATIKKILFAPSAFSPIREILKLENPYHVFYELLKIRSLEALDTIECYLEQGCIDPLYPDDRGQPIVLALRAYCNPQDEEDHYRLGTIVRLLLEVIANQDNLGGLWPAAIKEAKSSYSNLSSSSSSTFTHSISNSNTILDLIFEAVVRPGTWPHKDEEKDKAICTPPHVARKSRILILEDLGRYQHMTLQWIKPLKMSKFKCDKDLRKLNQWVYDAPESMFEKDFQERKKKIMEMQISLISSYGQQQPIQQSVTGPRTIPPILQTSPLATAPTLSTSSSDSASTTSLVSSSFPGSSNLSLSVPTTSTSCTLLTGTTTSATPPHSQLPIPAATTTSPVTATSPMPPPAALDAQQVRIIMKMNNEYYDGEQLSTHLSAGSNYLT